MSNQVDFLPFAIGNSANVLSQSDYAALAAILTGFQSGTAKSAQVNKALRQATVMAAVLANFIANNANVNVLDNGDTGTLLTNFVAALKAANASAGFLNKSNNLSDVLSAATALSNLGGLAKSNNLSDLTSIPTALTNLGLGTAAQRTVGTGTNQIPDMNSFISGSNGNGAYYKSANGSQYCRNLITIPANGSVTWTFPLAFPFQPLVTPPAVINPSVAMPNGMWTTGINTTSVTYYNPNSSGASIDVFAIL